MSLTILDGGMGQELVAKAGKATGLWSVQALLDAPHFVRDVHDAFFEAGAEIATANTYSVLPDRLQAAGIEDRLEELAVLACTLANAARDAAGHGLVAGSLGPLGFSYRPELSPPSDEAAEIYAKIARIHAPYVDMHLPETMSSVDQARGALMGCRVTGKPVWIAVSVSDSDGTLLRSGEPLTDLAPVLEEFKPDALLLNCSTPEAITEGLNRMPHYTGRIGAYANGFSKIEDSFNTIGATVDMLEIRKALDPKTYATFARQWVQAGATLIGGCCEIGPAHIAHLATELRG